MFAFFYESKQAKKIIMDKPKIAIIGDDNKLTANQLAELSNQCEIINLPEKSQIYLMQREEIVYQIEMIKQYDDLRYFGQSKKQREADIQPIRNYDLSPKFSRNQLCHCGSGKKYKKCCINK